ncbi:MAG: 2-hydroxyacid dehydrogenase, partial [Pseudomonadota bacterium]
IALVQGRIAAPKADLLRAFAPEGWEVEVWDPAEDAPEAFPSMAERADVVIGGAPPTDWPATPNLKLFQIPWTGFDFTSPEKMPAGLPVANTFEHETAIAEYAFAAMLEWEIGLRKLDADFRTGGWGGAGVGVSNTHGELLGKTLGVLGYGHIGHEAAVRAKAFGMRVIGLRRSDKPCPPELDWLGQGDCIDDLMAQSDYLLVACDMNEETIGLVNADRLAKMKPTGVLINVARGKVVDEEALWEALSSKRIGGAVIDVWYNYPSPDKPDVWPSNRPFQDLENVILSPHRSAVTEAMHERRWRFVASQLGRISAGEAPLNVVFEGTGGA